MVFYSLQADLETVDPNEHAELFSAVFGDSDTDDYSDGNMSVEEGVFFESSEEHVWTRVEEVEGLWHCNNFLSDSKQQALLKAIDCEGWFSDPLHNQAMRFGDLPGWAIQLCGLIQSSVGREKGLRKLESDQHPKTEGSHGLWKSASPFPAKILDRDPLFDQMIVNLYQPGEGISAHVDLHRFEDGIAIVSLESACVMSFRVVHKASDRVGDTGLTIPISNLCYNSGPCGHVDDRPFSGQLSCKELESSEMTLQAKPQMSRSRIYERDPTSEGAKRVDLLLSPGDLVITHGPARYNWTHEITHDKHHQVWKGQPILQQRRVSVTLRRLCVQKDEH